jgi:hypothetical protein
MLTAGLAFDGRPLFAVVAGKLPRGRLLPFVAGCIVPKRTANARAKAQPKMVRLRVPR